VAYFISVFSPETYSRFFAVGPEGDGLQRGQRNLKALVAKNRLLCYVTKTSNWVAVLEVAGEPFISDAPLLSP